MANLVRCVALATFTHYVPGFGMIHGSPTNDDDRARNPDIPATEIAQCVENGWIKDPRPAAAAVPVQTDRTIPDGSIADEPASLVFFTARHIGAGWYVIDGPDGEGDKSDKIKGKDAAAARVAELDADYRAALPALDPEAEDSGPALVAPADDGGDDDDGAPID